MKKRLTVIGIIIVALIAIGAGVLVWQKNARPTSEELEKQMAELEKQIAEKEEEIAYQKRLWEFENEPIPKSLSNAPRHATEDEQIPGITITKKGDKKLVVNKPQGYSIEVPSLLVMARTLDDKTVQFFEPETMCILDTCPSDIMVSIFEGTEEKTSEKKFLDYLRDEEKIPFEATVIDGKQGTKYYQESDGRKNPPTWNYHFEIGDKIYYIGISNINPSWKDAINSFKFITAQP